MVATTLQRPAVVHKAAGGGAGRAAAVASRGPGLAANLLPAGVAAEEARAAAAALGRFAGESATAARCGVRLSPSPMGMSPQAVGEFAALHAALFDGLACMAAAWARSPALRARIPVPDRVARIMLAAMERHDGPFLPGSFRPDILFDARGGLKVCEINARFALNGYLLTQRTSEALRARASPLLAAQGATPVESTLEVVETLLGRFDCSRPLWCIVGREAPNDLAWLEAAVAGAIEVKFVHPSQLSRERLAAIDQCILELHQDELLGLPDEALEHLMELSLRGLCLNPLWTILLLHDKRMLALLRAATAAEIPSDATRAALCRFVIPTIIPEGTGAQAAAAADALGVPLVAKPCRLGKGEGIVFQDEYADTAAFVAAAGDEFVLQTVVEQEVFALLAPDGASVVEQHVVGTVLCMDEWAAPGIFRSSPSRLVALCRGGFALVPARHVSPSLAPQLPLAAPVADIRAALCDGGVAMLHAGADAPLDEDGEALASFLRSIGGQLRSHSPLDGPVWHVRPQPGGRARSHQSGRFDIHTDESYSAEPARFVCMATLRADRLGGGVSHLARVADATALLRPDEVDTLMSIHVDWQVPAEFGGSGDDYMRGPVLLSEERARIRRDIISTKHLPAADAARFWAAFERLLALLESEIQDYFIPEGGVVILDNQRFVHARSAIVDDQRHLLRVRLDLEERPEILALGGGQRAPVVDKEALVAAIAARTDLTGRGGLYWSPSGGTTGDGARLCAMPTAVAENARQRRALARVARQVGAFGPKTVCVSLFPSGRLYRSLEVFGDLAVQCGATYLPVGADADNDEVAAILRRFGANAVCGWPSRLIELAQSVPLDTVTTVLYGGELLTEAKQAWLASRCAPGVRFHGAFGSAEAGVFAITEANSARYHAPPDVIHLEVLRDSGEPAAPGEFGRLVVTNLARRDPVPLVRFDMGDEGRLVGGGGGGGSAFEVRGRQASSTSHPFGALFLAWATVEREVLAHFGKPVLAQIVVHEDFVELAVAGAAPTPAVRAAFSELMRPGGVADARVVEVDAGALVRSRRSQKLRLFVDQRE